MRKSEILFCNLASTSPGKKKLKFSVVIQPQEALDFEVLPLQKAGPSLDDISALEKVLKMPLYDPCVDGSKLQWGVDIAFLIAAELMICV